MYTFLLTSIPLMLIYASLTNSEYEWKAFVPPSLIGFVIAIIACFIKEFFIFYSHVATSNFFAHFAYLSARDSVIPVLVLGLVFMLISKDEWNYKAAAMCPLALSFFCVYIPYFVISGKECQALFLLFVKPVLFISLAFIASSLLRYEGIFKKSKNASLTVLATFLLLVDLVVPSFIETVWYYKVNAMAWIVSSAIYVAVAVVLAIVSRIQGKSE